MPALGLRFPLQGFSSVNLTSLQSVRLGGQLVSKLWRICIHKVKSKHACELSWMVAKLGEGKEAEGGTAAPREAGWWAEEGLPSQEGTSMPTRAAPGLCDLGQAPALSYGLSFPSLQREALLKLTLNPSSHVSILPTGTSCEVHSHLPLQD